jgi:valyl-tRNA synthetase
MASGKMAIRDKFIISRLMNTCEAVNENFKAYKFGDAQHASYSFWMDDLCNVYLELIKPVVYDNSEENADKKWAAQATLWTCLETGLRLLHPMLPFVSEELWQRLPGRGTLGHDEKESIMISEYPQCNDAYKNAEAEASMMTTLKVIKSCRSLRASYQITNKTQTKFYVKAIVDESIIKGQISDIITLGNASSVEVNVDESAIPETVGIDVVDDQTTVFMDIKGLVDYDAEIKKLEKNLSKTMPALQNLEKKMQAKGYEENVKEDLKAQNAEKYEGLVKKVAEIHSAIENFRRLAELDK